MDEKSPRELIQIGDWQVEPRHGRIRRVDEFVSLRPKLMMVLVYLAQKAGEVVSKDELIDNVWSPVVVSDNVVQGAINNLRHALGDDTKNPKYIKTIPKLGYQLTAEVKTETAPLVDLEHRPGADAGQPADLTSALESVPPLFPAYGGDEPYMFVCYAHSDRAEVYPELLRLRNSGINLWYDEGIPLMSDWTEELANAINGSTWILFYVSPTSVTSENCRAEVQFALRHGKPLIAVHLEPTALTDGLDLLIGGQQALIKYELAEDDYQRKLTTVLNSSAGDGEVRLNFNQKHARRPLSRYLLIAGRALISGIRARLGARTRTASPVAAVPEKSIAVLPFFNMSSDPEQEHFCEGIAEDILNDLVHVPDLLVIARTSSFQYKGQNRDVREIGDNLNVALILEGSVQKVGDRVRVTAQLIDTKTGGHLWSDRYNRELADVFAVQDDIAGGILKELDLQLRGSRQQTSAVDPEAHSAYLLGRHHHNRAEFSKALEQYQQAINRQPDYADAHASIAATYLHESSHFHLPAEQRLPAIRASIAKALALDPAHPGALAAEAIVRFRVDRDYQPALDAIHEELARAPHSGVFKSYCEMLLTLGRFDMRLPLCERWVKIDPLNPEAHLQYGGSLVWSGSGRIDEARLAIQRGRDLGVTYGVLSANYMIARALGDIEALAQFIEEWRAAYGQPPAFALAQYKYATGDIERAQELARVSLEIGGLPAELQSDMWMLLGEPARALATQTQDLDEGRGGMNFMRLNPLGNNDPLPNVRNEPGFERLLKKVKLDDESVAKLVIKRLPF